MRKRSEVSNQERVEATIDPAVVPLFEHVNRKVPRLAPDQERLVEAVFDEDDVAVRHKALVAGLTVGERRGDYGTLLRALDEAEDNAREAHRLYLRTRLARDAFEIDSQLVEAGMREEATQQLQREKDEGQRSKQITDADVAGRAGTLFPDEWKALATKRARVKGTVEQMERLADLWFARCRDVGTMLGTLRK